METPNGTLSKSLNGRVVHTHSPSLKRRPRTKSSPGFLHWSFSMLARLLTWYSIITLLLRCPSSLEQCGPSSPPICAPYFQLKDAVAPHLEPYYAQYAAPYVERARPYYETVEQRVITPGWFVAKKYAAPRVQQAKEFGTQQWKKSVRPQMDKCQDLARQQYETKLAPHVSKVAEKATPYVDIARTNALQTYHEFLLPGYNAVKPYAIQGYEKAAGWTTETAVPGAVWAWNWTVVFLDGTVWPKLRMVYVETVEPQLVRIGERLGRYSNGKTNGKKTVVESPKAKKSSATAKSSKSSSSFAKPSQSTTPTSSATTTSSTSLAATASASASAPSTGTAEAARKLNNIVPPPEIDENEPENEVRRIARETVAEDLKDWQERYAKAADDGAAEIEERVEEISKKMIRRNARTEGKSLLDTLRLIVETEFDALKKDVLSIVSSFNNGTATREKANHKVTAAVRAAGLKIKDAAAAVRSWRESYEAEMQAAITTAAETHFKILESIRDLALQKIGMKWAWMDGITYKDWAKYHLLKERFDEWEGDLQKLIVSHPGLEAAQMEGAQVEDEAMKSAANAAKGLAEVKQVAGLKMDIGDVSDEFDLEAVKQKAEEIRLAKLEAEKKAAEEKAAAEAKTAEEKAAREAEKAAAEFAAEAEKLSTPDTASADQDQGSAATADTHPKPKKDAAAADSPVVTVIESSAPTTETVSLSHASSSVASSSTDVEEAQFTILPIAESEDQVRLGGEEEAKVETVEEEVTSTVVLQEVPTEKVEKDEL